MSQIKQYISEYGLATSILKAPDYILHAINRFLRDRFYRWTRDDFSFKEAFFWPKDISLYLRYSKIISELRNTISNYPQKIKILEVGSCGEGVARFLKYSGDYEKFDIQITDENADSIKNVKLGKPMVADGCNLPFENNEFDVVISVDTLEHVAKNKRKAFLKELRRVSKNIVLMHFVMDDPGRQFTARDADLRFQKWHIKRFGRENIWTKEHLEIDSPNCREIEEVFPNPLIVGTQNIETWFDYMTLGAKPFVGFFAGLSYAVKWKHKDNLPPFHGCFVKWINPDSNEQK